MDRSKIVVCWLDAAGRLQVDFMESSEAAKPRRADEAATDLQDGYVAWIYPADLPHLIMILSVSRVAAGGSA